MKTKNQIRESLAFKFAVGMVYITFMFAAAACWFFSSASYFVSL